MKYLKPEMDIVEFDESVLTDMEGASGTPGWENPDTGDVGALDDLN